jgi:putative hemolysin
MAPPDMRVRANASRYVDMNLMPKEAIDTREAIHKLPPLLKGYVRAGAWIGDGAVIDWQFGTTDVFICFPLSKIDDRYRSRFQMKQ